MKLAPRTFEFFFWSAIPGYYLLLSLAVYFDIVTRLVTLPIRIIPLMFLFVVYLIAFKHKKINYHKAHLNFFLVFSSLYIGRILYDGVIADNLFKQSWSSYLSYYLLSAFLPALFLIRMNISVLSQRLEKVFFHGMLFLTTFFTLIYYNKLGSYRIKGVEDGAISSLAIGYIGALMVSLSLNILINQSKKYHIKPFWAFFAIASSIIPIVLSASRGPIVAILLSTFIISIHSKVKNKKLKLSFLLLITIFMSDYFISFVDKTGSSVIDRFTNIGEDIENGASSAIRLQIWKKAFEQYLDSPILGAQLEVFGDHPHNVIIEAFMATGTFGGGIFLYLILIASYRAYKIAKDPSISWLSIVFFVSLVQNSFSGAIWAATWLFVSASVFLGMKLPK